MGRKSFSYKAVTRTQVVIILFLFFVFFEERIGGIFKDENIQAKK